MIGRPSKLNEELIKKICEVIQEGLPIKYACDLLVITQKSYENWYNQGKSDVDEDKDTIYADFFLSIKNAQATYIYEANKDIKSGRPGWQGAAWWLERTRQDFMPKQEFVAEEGKVQVVLGGKIKEIKKNDNSER